MIVEADKPVPRVATIGFEFKLQLNIDRDMESCIDSLVVQTVNQLLLLSKELKLKFEPKCDQPAMSWVCLLLQSLVSPMMCHFIDISYFIYFIFI